MDCLLLKNGGDDNDTIHGGGGDIGSSKMILQLNVTLYI